MNSVSFVELFLDVSVVIQSLYFFKEHFEVLFHFFGSLRANVACNGFALFARVQLKSLANLLVVSAIPISKA